ncbi:MAG: NAD(P)-binding domain-containing protein [Terracidiphilus sp.]
MATVGFVGLGIMGRPMLRNLLKAGHTVVAYGRTPATLDSVVADGAQRASPTPMSARARKSLSPCSPTALKLKKSFSAPTASSPGTKSGSLIIDMSSISPLVSQKIAAACDAKRRRLLDAPVSGGEPKAIDGTLAIMVGGEPEVFCEVRANPEEPRLQRHAHGSGSARATPASSPIKSWSPATSPPWARRSPSPRVADSILKSVVNAVKGGTRRQRRPQRQGPMLIARNFKPGFKINLHQKDLRNALQTAEANHVFLPLTAQVQQMLSSLIANGKGDLDHSAIATFIETASDVKVKVPTS